MIRFKTIDPVKDATPAPKPAEKPAVPVAAAESAEAPAAEPAPEPKGKGLARKTPLRARKPDAARLFRD